MTTPAFAPGSFVRSGASTLGIGKVIETTEPGVSVGYFVSPADPIVTDTLPLESLDLVTLEQETRVYHRSPSTLTWRSGRVRVRDDDHYLIRFPNGADVLVPGAELQVRCDCPIEDPSRYLACRISESQYVHARRSAFSRAITQQRGACAGMGGLLSAVVELEGHQIEVVRRVLQDPVQRYLLADEVGLGKTIEAGIIVRQYVLDHPAYHCVVVVVPDHLERQWELELADKLRLEAQLGEGVHIVAHGDAARLGSLLPDAGLVVVDEAHQIASLAAAPQGSSARRPFDLLCGHASRRDARLLLLSATPTLHNDAVGFQAMLHLLDPDVYPLGDMAGFQARLADHLQTAELFHLFQPGQDNDYLDGVLTQLCQRFPADEHLASLACQLRPHLAFGQPDQSEERDRLIQALRIHINEAYRLHRRLLRNRRADERLAPILTGRDGLRAGNRRIYPDPTLVAAIVAVDHWRTLADLHAGAVSPDQAVLLATCHRLFREGLAGGGRVLADLALIRLGQVVDAARLRLTRDEHRALIEAPQFAGEVAALEAIRDHALAHDPAPHRDELQAHLTELLERYADARIVVFCNFPASADEVFAALQLRFGVGVVRHDQPMWQRFRTDPECRILICDRRAEEGLNLQGRRMILVHADLPFSPNRIEQRIGRVDRFGQGRAAINVALIAQEDDVQRAWCTCLNAAYGVFERSVAALQYFIEQRMRDLERQLLAEGVDGIRVATESMQGEDGEINRVLREIQAIDELDAIERNEWQEGFIDGLQNAETLCGQTWADAFHAWVVGHLQFASIGENGREDAIRRYRFRRPSFNGPSTLMPVSRLVGQFRHVLDEDHDSGASHEPSTYPIGQSRRTCQARRSALARLGDPFLDALADYLRQDDRGTCFATWRFRPGAEIDRPAYVGFRFDFIIEAGLTDALALLPEQAGYTHEALRRQADQWFPPRHVTLWLDADGEAVSKATLLALLEEEYRSTGDTASGRDYNLNHERWPIVGQHFPAADWADRVTAVTRAARRLTHQLVADDQTTTEQLRAAEEESAARQAQFASRVAVLSGVERQAEQQRAELDAQLGQALLASARCPRLILDSVGAVLLADWDPFDGE